MNHPYLTISPFYKSLSSQDNGHSCLKRLKLGSLHVVPLSIKILVLKFKTILSNIRSCCDPLINFIYQIA